ncbi:MAG: hypothetical protein OS112_05010 [Methanoregula sp.]|nr:MAG: hypothetical protein OS112_05010 [Methanoregula sp.]
MEDPDKRGNGCGPDKSDSKKTSDGDLNWSGGMTLEAIVDATGEFEHLNELVILQIKKSGGLNSTGDYFKIVTPILDLLEVEIRVRSVRGITHQQMKLVIQDWIDREIAELR